MHYGVGRPSIGRQEAIQTGMRGGNEAEQAAQHAE
jgi:hypothetical protein